MNVYTYANVHMLKHIYIYIYTHIHRHARIHVCIHIHVCIYIYIYIHTHLFITFPSDIPAPVLPPRLFAARGRSRGFSSRGLAGAAPPAARSEVEDLNFFFVVFIKHFFCISFLLRG